MLIRPHDAYDTASLIMELPVVNKGGRNFERLDTRDSLAAFGEPGTKHRIPLYLPCHLNCVFLAKRILSASGSNSLTYLWSNLKSRFDKVYTDFQWPGCSECPLLCGSGSLGFQGIGWKDEQDLITKIDQQVNFFLSLVF